MTVKDFERLYDYGYWANRRLFDAIGRITAEEFTRNVAGSYGSIRDTLVRPGGAAAAGVRTRARQLDLLFFDAERVARA